MFVFLGVLYPYIDEPKEHLKLKFYRLKKKTDKGQDSITVCGLNNTERVVSVRLEIGEKLNKLIISAKDKYDLYIYEKILERKNNFINIIKDLLRECQPTASYSATTSTILHSSETFNDLVQKMKDEELWDDKHEELYQKSLDLVLDYI